MSIALRIKETSTTTGTGNLTLAGAETDFVSFNSVYSTNQYFHAMIVNAGADEWEYGIYILSASTTLVRSSTTVISSSNSDSLVSFSAGTKDVFCVDPPGGFMSMPFVRTGWETSRHITQPSFATVTYSANQYRLSPYLNQQVKTIENLGVPLTTAAGTKIRIGIYSVDWTDSNLWPQALIATTGDITGYSSGTFVTGAISGGPIVLQPGWYWVTVISDGGCTFRNYSASSVLRSFLGGTNTSTPIDNNVFHDIHDASWTALPTVAEIAADSPTISNTAAATIFLGDTTT